MSSDSPRTAAFDNETEACRHCPTPEVHPTRIGGILTYEGRCEPETCERHDHSYASPPASGDALPWRVFYDNYETGSAFIGPDVDTIIVDDLPYEKAEDIVGAHNAALAASPPLPEGLDDEAIRLLRQMVDWYNGRSPGFRQRMVRGLFEQADTYLARLRPTSREGAE